MDIVEFKQRFMNVSEKPSSIAQKKTQRGQHLPHGGRLFDQPLEAINLLLQIMIPGAVWGNIVPILPIPCP